MISGIRKMTKMILHILQMRGYYEQPYVIKFDSLDKINNFLNEMTTAK